MTQVTLDDIQKATIAYFGITQEMLLTPKRHARFVLYRAVAYRVARDLTHQSLVQIGLAFGGRDHTSVLHGLKWLEKRRDEEVEAAIIAIKRDAKNEAPHARRHVIRAPFKSARKPRAPLFIRSAS